MILGKTLLTEHDRGMSFNTDTGDRITILNVEINCVISVCMGYNVQ